MNPTAGISKPSSSNERRIVLEAKLQELTGVFRDRSGLAVEVLADALDAIQLATDRDMLVQRMNIGARMLSDVRDAILAWDNGHYGFCEDCEEPISPKRLDAIPWAHVCVNCQEARDRRVTEADSDDLSLAA
jgi:DnaK suppressor protein